MSVSGPLSLHAVRVGGGSLKQGTCSLRTVALSSERSGSGSSDSPVRGGGPVLPFPGGVAPCGGTWAREPDFQGPDPSPAAD